ncbi:hypothetical protein BGX29_003642 [Mortierella sp. GBA35]|nr:hypothetical protein BGX29_003642 [Mortierella sp. GBA35]
MIVIKQRYLRFHQPDGVLGLRVVEDALELYIKMWDMPAGFHLERRSRSLADRKQRRNAEASSTCESDRMVSL